MLPPALLQRKSDGGLAAGPTAEEFKDRVLKGIKETTEKYSTRPDCADVLALTGGKWRYSWDGAGIHRPEVADEVGVEQVELPPYSPDMHCVVEHAVANTWKKFHKAKRALPLKPSMEEIMDCLERCFEEAAKPEIIYADAMRLHQIYRAIATPKGQPAGEWEGSGGDWPHPRLYH